ncbi:MAG: hypothetical protein J7M14_02430 [Planctomycetes bacterium]|nr:hypothetical protein [Planctomycetota bacterium]
MSKMYYSEEEAAAKLGVTIEGLADFIREGSLRLFKDGERNMYMASEVDALAPQEEVAEFELAPAEEPTEAAEAPSQGEPALTSEGISIFDDEDLEIESADPMAKTQVAPSIDEQIAPDSGGSGLLDLTQESDDTSLGAVIDHIDLDETGEADAAAVSAYGEPVEMADQAAAAVAVPEVQVEIDATAGLFSGLLAGCAIVGLLIGAVTLAVVADIVPGYLSAMKENIVAVAGGAAGLVIIFGIIGLFIGKSVARREQAIQNMGG